ncbi:Ig-like domain-containing protein, partial [bacterium]|nr:Ig-like domain-containing protein [bacterium]
MTDQTAFSILKMPYHSQSADTGDRSSLHKRMVSPSNSRSQGSGNSANHSQFVDPVTGFGDPGSADDDFGYQEPEFITATFEDLRIDNQCDVFGSFNDDGSITATKVLLIREDEPPEPDLIGEVMAIDFASLLITIENDEDVHVIQLTGETFVGLFYGHFGDEDPFGPEFDPNDSDPAFKKTDEFNEPPAGVIFDESRRLEDVVIGMQIGVYFADPPIASAVIILNGGQRTRGFEFTGRIDFVDQYGGYIGFRNAFEIDVSRDTPITLGSGVQAFTLKSLQEELAAGQRENWQPRFLKIFIEEGTDPERRTATEIIVIPLGEEPIPSDDYFLARIDDAFGQIIEFENRISPSPPPGVRFTRNTSFNDLEGNTVDVYDLYEDMRVQISGVEKIWPGDIDGERIAESVIVIGGEPFEFDGLVESVDESAGTFTLTVRESELILRRAFYAGFSGEELPVEDFIRSFEEDLDASQIIIQFNPLGPGIVRLQLHNPERPRPFRDDEEVFEDYEVSIVEESTDTGEIQRFLTFTQLPDFELADDAVLLDPNGNQIGLSDLVGKGVFFQGEVFVTEEDVRPVVSLVKTYDVVDEIEIVLEIGDFDEEGVENDVILSVFDTKGNEIAGDLNVFLDFLPPVTVQSGALARNIGPGVHKLKIEVPSLDLSVETEFVIRGRGKGFTVEQTLPKDEATNVPEATEIRVTFSSPIQTSGNFVNADVFLRPGFGGEPLGGLRLENDGRTLVIPVKLEANTSYTMSIAQATSTTDQFLSEPVIVTFTTGGELESFGGIEGTLALVEALTKQAKVSDIVFGEIVAVDEQGEKAGKSVIDEAGAFSMRGLPEGDYRLFAKVETTTGKTKGAFDANRDGEPDNVEVFAGKITDLGVFELPRPLVLREASIVQDSESPITVDFDPSRADNGKDVETVTPGDKFELAVYVKGVSDLIGF